MDTTQPLAAWAQQMATAVQQRAQVKEQRHRAGLLTQGQAEQVWVNRDGSGRADPRGFGPSAQTYGTVSAIDRGLSCPESPRHHHVYAPGDARESGRPGTAKPDHRV